MEIIKLLFNVLNFFKIVSIFIACTRPKDGQYQMPKHVVIKLCGTYGNEILVCLR
jgi:hypothetical protein